VGREEVSEEEWRQEIESTFRSSGLIPSTLSKPPSRGIVNLNFGTHNCVHMGTRLEAEISAYEPSAVSFPTGEGDDGLNDGGRERKLHTLVMFDADANDYMHWLVVNVPGVDIDRGQTIAEYASPTPPRRTGPHRYVIAAMEQSQSLSASSLVDLRSTSCQASGRDQSQKGGRLLPTLQRRLGLGEPLAANYFVVQHDPFVDSIVDYCEGRQSG